MALKLLAVMASLSLSGAFVAPRRQVRMCAADQVSADSALLREAALARTAEPEAVYTAIRRLEKARAMDGEKIGEALNGDWRLIFTSGEKKTQDAMGGAKISYVPIKAVQVSFARDAPRRPAGRQREGEGRRGVQPWTGGGRKGCNGEGS